MRDDEMRPKSSTNGTDIAIKLGGAAVLAGMFSRNPKTRKYLAGAGLVLLAGALAPDFIRYMKIEAM